MRYSTDKDCQALIVALVGAGWIYKAKGKHGKLLAPGGGMLVFSRTPSDWRAMQKMRRDIRRISGGHF